MTLSVELYDINNIDKLNKDNSQHSQLITAYFIPMMKLGSLPFIQNVNTQLYLLTAGNLTLPVTVNDIELENCYVCSPYNHYITYTKVELTNLKNPFLETTIAYILDLLGIFAAQAQINRVVIVNNLLLSTNLYPPISTQEIQAITIFLCQKFPNHAIMFRSINTFVDNELMHGFQTNNYHLIGSRQIYLFHPADESSRRSKMRSRLKQDTQLIHKHGYTVLDKSAITAEDIPRIVELYNLLYLEKYSYHNPQFTEEFIQLTLQNPAWCFQILKKDHSIDGVIGYYHVNNIMTTPILGYDTQLPQEIGLYRMLSALLTNTAKTENMILHQSSGAASFKRLRGFLPNIEYSAVYISHLPWWRKMIWLVLKLLVNKLAIPLMQKYKL